jgi:potassium-transporting ATPase potassium-binding subunit
MWQGVLQIGFILIIVSVIAPFFGRYIAHVFLGQKTILDRISIPIDSF